MSNVDWEHWLNMDEIRIGEAVALSMDIDPEKMTMFRLDGWHYSQSSFQNEEEENKFNKRCILLINNAFSNKNIRSRPECLLTTINQEQNHTAKIFLEHFAKWAINKVHWDIPPELKSLETTKEKVEDKLYREDKPNGEPWKVHQEGDPEPEQDWYTAARYFARELVRDDSNLLTKKKYLYQKISDSLADVGIYKRGGKKAFDSQTIRKALANIKYDR